jgi:uncharacterized membrane protein
MITVKEVFSKAFAPVPVGFDILYQLALVSTWGIGITINDAYYIWNEDSIPQSWALKADTMWRSFNKDMAINISNRDAEAFRGFFGAEYDNALDQLQETK